MRNGTTSSLDPAPKTNSVLTRLAVMSPTPTSAGIGSHRLILQISISLPIRTNLYTQCHPCVHMMFSTNLLKHLSNMMRRFYTESQVKSLRTLKKLKTQNWSSFSKVFIPWHSIVLGNAEFTSCNSLLKENGSTLLSMIRSRVMKMMNHYLHDQEVVFAHWYRLFKKHMPSSKARMKKCLSFPVCPSTLMNFHRG